MSKIELTSPRGRLVQGDAFEPQTKDQNGAPLTIKTGPNAGQLTQKWFMAVAFQKDDPTTLPYLQKMAEHARTCWPAYFAAFNANTPPLFGCSHPRFSIKIMDGDGLDDNGKSNAAKDGFAGCYVVKYSTSIKAPGVWQEPNFDDMAQITDPRALPCGYYVRVLHTVSSNENDQRPGMYVNLDKVAISADQAGAAVIQRGTSAADAFGGAGGATPPPTTPPAVPAPVTPPPPPHSGYMDAAPAGPVMLPAAGGATYDAMKAAGWTDDMLIQHGMMQAPK